MNLELMKKKIFGTQYLIKKNFSHASTIKFTKIYEKIPLALGAIANC
jgi:hypothetical protein